MITIESLGLTAGEGVDSDALSTKRATAEILKAGSLEDAVIPCLLYYDLDVMAVYNGGSQWVRGYLVIAEPNHDNEAELRIYSRQTLEKWRREALVVFLRTDADTEFSSGELREEWLEALRDTWPKRGHAGR